MPANMLTTRNVEALTVALMAAQRAARFGARMRERREELGLSQSEVADRIPVVSVTKDYISRWELGKVEASGAYLEHIANALETTVGDLMAGPVADRDEKGATPDLLGGRSQLDRLERQVQDLAQTVDQLVSQLSADQAARAAARAAEASERKPAASRRKPPAKAKKRAAG